MFNEKQRLTAITDSSVHAKCLNVMAVLKHSV